MVEFLLDFFFFFFFFFLITVLLPTFVLLTGAVSSPSSSSSPAALPTSLIPPTKLGLSGLSCTASSAYCSAPSLPTNASKSLN